VAKGVRFLNPPTRMEWGEWLCQFVDPDGNEFDLKQPIFFGQRVHKGEPLSDSEKVT